LHGKVGSFVLITAVTAVQARLVVTLACLVLLIACGEPPNKEMDQAQGAIDAARAAGADQYARDELAAATTALTRANEAVEQRDYRLALNHALDARERAQEAARQAAGQKAIVRSEVEREITAIRTSLDRAAAQVAAAQTAKIPVRQLAAPRAVLADAETALQKARTALAKEDYLAARAMLEGVRQRVDGVTAALTKTVPTRSIAPVRRDR